MTKSRPCALGTGAPAIFHAFAGVSASSSRDNLHQLLSARKSRHTSAIADVFGSATLPSTANQRRCVHIPSLRRHLHQHLARRHSHGAQFRAHRRSCPAAKRAHVPRNKSPYRPSPSQWSRKAHAVLRQPVARATCECSGQPPPCPVNTFNLAIGGNVQPRAQIFGQLMPAKASAGLLRPTPKLEQAYEQSASKHLQKIAPIQLHANPALAESTRRASTNAAEFAARAHRPAPSVHACAARLIASRMRG